MNTAVASTTDSDNNAIRLFEVNDETYSSNDASVVLSAHTPTADGNLHYGRIPTSIIPIKLPESALGKQIVSIKIFERFMEILYDDGLDCRGLYYYSGRKIYHCRHAIQENTVYLHGRDVLLINDYYAAICGGNIDSAVILDSTGMITYIHISENFCDLAVIRSLAGLKYSIYYEDATGVLRVLCGDSLYKCHIAYTSIIRHSFVLYPDTYLEENVAHNAIIVTPEPNTVLISHISSETPTTISRITEGDALYGNVARIYDYNVSRPHIGIFDKDLLLPISRRQLLIDILPFCGGYITRICENATPLAMNWIVNCTTIYARAMIFRDIEKKYKLAGVNHMPELCYAGRAGYTFYMYAKGVLYTWL